MSLINLTDNFGDWLKNVKKMKNRPNISQKRNKFVQVCKGEIEDFLIVNRNNENDKNELLEWLRGEQKLGADSDEREAIRLFIEFLGETAEEKEGLPHGEEVEPLQSQESSEAPVFTYNKIIGRVEITIKSQAKPTEFDFWSEDSKDIHVEIGSVVTVLGDSDKGQVKIIGMVTELYNTSSIDSPIEDFYSTGYGNPEVELATMRPIVKVSKVTVVFRSDGRFEPPGGNWPVFFASEEDILRAYGSDIPPEYSVLAGFTSDWKKEAIPIYLDSRYLLGYEGAHVNISGASGLATKTSYALFLINSIVSTSMNQEGGGKYSVAAILFNVKEADLMRIDDGPADKDRLNEILKSKENQLKLWNKCLEEGVDPFELRRKLRFFAPPDPSNARKAFTLRGHNKKTDIFSFGLYDLIGAGGAPLYSLFDPDDLDEKASAVVSSIYDDLRETEGLKLRPKPKNFEELIKALAELTKTKQNKVQEGQWVDIGFGNHHTATVSKVTSRLSTAIDHRLKGLVLKKDSYGNPIMIEDLKPNDIWIIDISKLHTTGQRLTFTQVYNTLNRLLEAKRNGEEEFDLGGKRIDLRSFPDRVIVFVDELNKFAPSGRYGAELKAHIVDITARGRSIGLTLIGAEQVANQIDEELLSNISTFVVGRSHALSLKGDVFQWLQGGLKDKAMSLEKGDMILWHAVHSKPVLISFPKPIHNLP